MKYGLLVRKLNSIDDQFVTCDNIKKYCSVLKIAYLDAIKYLTRHKHLYVILRGIFYKPSISERKLKSLGIDHLEAISKAMKIKGVKNWYFALETAMKFNGLTHEFFAVDFIINDTVFRAKPIRILSNKVKFIKIKRELFDFGIKKSENIRYSDVEKTALDMIYLKRYSGMENESITESTASILELSSRTKLKKYAKKYNKQIEKFVSKL